MSLMVEVSLISGKTVSLQMHGDESVETLRGVHREPWELAKVDSWTSPEVFLMEERRSKRPGCNVRSHSRSRFDQSIYVAEG